MAVAVVARLLWLHCGCLLVFLTVIALSLVGSHGGTLTRVAVTALAVFACGCTRTVAFTVAALGHYGPQCLLLWLHFQGYWGCR